MTREQFIRICFVVLLIFIAHQVLLIVLPFYKAIFWSAILTFGFYPLYQKFRRLLSPHETLAALLMTLIIFLVVIPPMIYLIVNLTSQAIQLYQWVSDYIRQGRFEELVDHIRSLHFIQKIETRIVEWELLRENAESWLLTSSRSIGNLAASQIGTITKNIFFLVMNVFFMSFLIFIFLKDGEKIYQYIYHAAPLEERNKHAIAKQINDTFAAVIRGQLLTALTQAIAAGFIFWFLNIPLPIFFAAAIFFASLIPVVGASTVWVPIVIYLAASGQQTKAIILFFFGALFISLIDNLMKPALIGEKTKLPYFLLFFGILGGLQIYGLMGIFVAPVVLSLFFALVKIYQEKNW
jgi:predicted PurR-regulated permease PerM